MKAETDTLAGKQENKKIRKILLYTALCLFLIFLIFYFIPLKIPAPVFGAILLLISIDFIVLVANTRKFYNWGLAFILIILISTYFRRMRWPISGFLVLIGYTGIACFSFYSASVFLRKFKHNRFLRYIGFASCVILAIVSMGLLWKNMHWPLAGEIVNTGLILFIPFLFAFVFTLPASNYVNWNATERAAFFRAIIIPMSFIYILCVLLLVLPDLWTSISRTKLIPFEMFDFELLNKPGLL